jgi:NarL family two-component system response regulator LiaR
VYTWNSENCGVAVDQATIRVLVVDDQTIVREGICALLDEIADIEVVGEAANGQEAVERSRTLKPDVVLMDLVMPHLDGVEATRQITSTQKGARVLVLTSFAGDEQVFPAIKAGAVGYLLKDAGAAELVEAIRQVHRGHSFLHPIIAQKVLQELKHPSERPPTPDPLTHREMEVMRLMAQGLTNSEIARSLTISEATVRSHISNILSKLHLANRVQAALYALQEGITSLEDRSGVP